MRILKSVVNSIGYVLSDDIAEGRRRIQNLKTQIDTLNDQLRSAETMSTAITIELNDRGPFRMPLLTNLKSLITQSDGVLAEFESHDGKAIFVTLQPLIAAQVVNDFLSAATNAALHPSIEVDFPSFAAVFRLPTFSCYGGHFDVDFDTRVLIFSSQGDQKVFLPVSVETYEKMIRQFEAALATHSQTDAESEVSVVLALPNPVRDPDPDPVTS
jgi:hypothetical protein